MNIKNIKKANLLYSYSQLHSLEAVIITGVLCVISESLCVCVCVCVCVLVVVQYTGYTICMWNSCQVCPLATRCCTSYLEMPWLLTSLRLKLSLDIFALLNNSAIEVISIISTHTFIMICKYHCRDMSIHQYTCRIRS
jgi:hypothetical protein